MESFDSYKSTSNALVIQRTRMPSGLITHVISNPYWEDRKGVTKGGNNGTFFSFWFLKQHHLRFLQPKWQELKEWDIIAV